MENQKMPAEIKAIINAKNYINDKYQYYHKIAISIDILMNNENMESIL